jgi:branched-chain amino acid transport system substrate-binding protein
MKRFLAVLLGLALLASACSEDADPVETSQDSSEDTAAGDDAPDADASDEATSEPEPDTSDSSGDEADEATSADDTAETDADDDGETTDEAPPASDDGSVVAGLAGEAWFLGEIPSAAVAADPDLEPIKIGMINQEDTPLGSFPEVRAAAETAVTFINAELGGVDGRPIELSTCITSFNPEQSAGCAQELVQEGVVALVGGVDVTSNGSFPVIEQNELPMVGGIPAGLVEQRSPYAFSFSGGGAGAASAFMKHAADNGATKVLLAYGEFESFEVAARDYAAVVGKSLGLEVELLSFSLFVADYLPVITKAVDIGADAVIVLAADSACIPVMQAMSDLDVQAQLYLTGACASDPIIDASGDNILGVLFNSEGPVEEGDPQGDLYAAAVDLYATEPAGGAGTVGFRGMMNLYGLLAELGGDNISSESILGAVRATVDQRSFWGHPYTCDGQQVPGLPALCAPQQILFEVTTAGGDPSGVGDWIDTAELFQVVDG